MTTLTDLESIAYQLDFDEFAQVDVQLVLVRGRYGKDRWAIREHGACLSKSGKWLHEPMPSSRTDAYLAKTRWDTKEEALAFWMSDKCPGSRLRA